MFNLVPIVIITKILLLYGYIVCNREMIFIRRMLTIHKIKKDNSNFLFINFNYNRTCLQTEIDTFTIIFVLLNLVNINRLTVVRYMFKMKNCFYRQVVQVSPSSSSTFLHCKYANIKTLIWEKGSDMYKSCEYKQYFLQQYALD